MFKKNYKMLILTDKIIGLYIIVGKDLLLENKLKIDETIFKNGSIVDYSLYSYLLEKLLVNSKNSNLIIKYMCRDLIFRNLDINDIADADLKGYFDYNIQDYFPFDVSQYKFLYNRESEVTYIYGIKRDFIEKLLQLINSYGIESKVLTVSASEVASHIHSNPIKDNCLVLNYYFNVLEVITIKNSTIEAYNMYEIVGESDMESGSSLANRLFKIFEGLKKDAVKPIIYTLSTDNDGIIYKMLNENDIYAGQIQLDFNDYFRWKNETS